MEFEIDDWLKYPIHTGDAPKIRFAHDVIKEDLTKEELLDFPAFSNWIKTLKSSFERQQIPTHAFADKRVYLRSIEIQSIDRKPRGDKSKGDLLFVKLNADISNDEGKRLPGIAFLRGGSVAILMIVRPSDSPDERYVIMTEQARIPAGSLSFKEIPAGMIDKAGDFKGAAAQEIEQEVGIRLRPTDLIDMTERATRMDSTKKEKIQNAIYPSPGGCDEFINIYLWERVRPRLEIESLKENLREAGDRAVLESIKVTLEPYEKLVEVGARDAKTLAAWSLYEYLKRVDPDLLKDVDENPF
ncbi:uncharacterized protein PV09_06650 [Verruconis gallopava]|uniref:Nudix hydrolase domain-containing protein n=1 Tax=Verruconis gallopava TaxID=253628 RepID=A0A0D1YN35_9PEZI|nr:uncharacterized protein PV09_06650 [Verruconis gallopava]KIW02167.1 hypothetical protein PV09_06650 [Verruconis gallopava]